MSESQKQISANKKTIKSLQIEVEELKIQLAQANRVVTCMTSVLTEGQVRKIMSPGSLQWTWNDISNAICLHAAGPRAYRHLYRKGFPLPSLTTLHRWIRKIQITEGIITPSIEFMRHETDMSKEDKLCVLVFDEMKVVETYEHDAAGDFVRKPANQAQVVIARGLWKSWKQPIYFDFDTAMTKDTLNAIIYQLEDADYTVVAIVSDMGASNRTLWKHLGVSIGILVNSKVTCTLLPLSLILKL